MKNTRKMIPAIAMLLISAVMLTTASYAWFTIGTTADATGMNVTAAAASSLLIVDEATTLNSSAAAMFDTADNTIEFAAIRTGLKPATKAAEGTSSTVGLMAPEKTNLKTETESGVDHLTGAYNGTYVGLDETAEGEYYIEYVAYIASAGAAMKGYDLSVTVNFNTITLPVYNATTIDFLVKAKSTDSAAVLVKSVNALTAKGTAGANVLDLGTYDIPVVPTVPAAGETDSGDYITVIMRVYVDGALPDANKAGYTYVRNSQIDLNGTGYGFGVHFDATKAAETTADGTDTAAVEP